MFNPVLAGLRVLGWLGAVWLCLGDAVSLVPTATSSWKLLVVCGSVPSLLGTLLPVPTATSSPPALLFATRLQRPQKLHPSRSTSAVVTASLERSPWRPLPGEGPGGVGNQPLAVCRAFGACGWARTFSGAVKPEIAPVVFPRDPKQSGARARNGRCRPWPLARGCRISGDRQDPSAPVSRKQEDGNRQLLRKRFGDGGRDAATTWGGDILWGQPWELTQLPCAGSGRAWEGVLGGFCPSFPELVLQRAGRNLPAQPSLGFSRSPSPSLLRGGPWHVLARGPKDRPASRGDGEARPVRGRRGWHRPAGPSGGSSTLLSPGSSLQTFALRLPERFLLRGASRDSGKFAE